MQVTRHPDVKSITVYVGRSSFDPSGYRHYFQINNQGRIIPSGEPFIEGQTSIVSYISKDPSFGGDGLPLSDFKDRLELRRVLTVYYK